MNGTLIKPILGLDNEFPNSLYIIYQESTKRYLCYCFEGNHGLACFSTNEKAIHFGNLVNFEGLSVKEVTFDEAREIGKERPPTVICLLFLDNLNNPIIHYIR